MYYTYTCIFLIKYATVYCSDNLPTVIFLLLNNNLHKEKKKTKQNQPTKTTQNLKL